MPIRRTEWVEFVKFDPEDTETFPSVCNVASDVEARFGFKGGELLIFDEHGAYIGEVVKTMEDDETSRTEPNA